MRPVTDTFCQPLLHFPVFYALLNHFFTDSMFFLADPDQLPPTVLSANMNEAEANFRTSQMDRLAQTGVEVIELDQQFRMHSHIGDFISGEFYGNRVRNATGTDTAPECAMFRDWVKAYAAKHGKNIQTPANSFFISVEGTKIFRRKQATSSCNPAYIERAHDVVMDLLRHTARTKNVEHIQQLRGKCHIAMVCYYAEELALLKKWLHGVENLADIVDVVTVDSTQGWEWDFVILSTTRPGGSYGLGFVADRKRQNVALSRAKYGQVTIGHKNMGRRFATTEGQRGSVGGTGFAGWENYWKYHVNHLNCCLEVQGSIQQVLQALNVDQNNYEEVPEGRH